jgi:hypothetical protein
MNDERVLSKEAGVSTNHRFIRQESVSTEVGDSISKSKKYTKQMNWPEELLQPNEAVERC